MAQKVIVAGGRDFTDSARMLEVLNECVNAGWLEPNAELVCGMARGADNTARLLFKQHGNPIHEFHADWDGLGRRAGFVRNEDMGRFADMAIVFWDGNSKGSKHMIDFMKKLGKPLITVEY